MQNIFKETITLEWAKLEAREALRCLPAIALALGIGLALGAPTTGMAAAAGAMSVGFGAFQRVRWFRAAPMLLASIGMGVSTLAGSLAGQSVLGVAAVAIVWGFVYGLLMEAGSGVSWVGLQCVIIALVASGYPVTVQQGFNRAGLTLAGGLLQTVLVDLGWRLTNAFKNEDRFSKSLENVAQSLTFGLFRRNLLPNTTPGRYAWQMAVVLGTTAAACRALTLPNGYWVPMTALLVLKPDFQQTLSRGIARIAGTLAGVAVATLLATLLRPGPGVLAALVVFFAWLCYTLIRVNYAVYAVCITSCVVFMLSFMGLPEKQVVLHRALNTTVGGCVALLAYAYFLPATLARIRRVGGGRTMDRRAPVAANRKAAEHE